MAGDDGRRRRSRQAAAVVLVLCALAQSLTCFSLQGLREKVKQDEVVNEATAMDSRTESILSNGKGSASAAATGNDGLLHTDLDQSDGTGISKQMSQLEDNMADEAAWRRLNPSLHCGQSKMTIKAMEPGAADLKLDMGDMRPLPLIQVPETCGYSVLQNALDLTLVVPYDGCNVIQENGNYVFLMSWLETPVKFTCPMLTSSTTPPALTTPKPAPQPSELPFPLEPESLNRHKRHVYNPSSAYYAYMYYLYYMHMLRQTTTTTAKPGSTTAKPSQTKPPVPPYNPYYYYNSYYNYYYPYYYPLPVKTTTAKPATTTGPVTGTSTAPTTKTPVKTPFPYIHYHYPYPYHYHRPAGQPVPVPPYYYPVMPHYHGTPPPTTKPTTLSPSATAKPATTAKPCPHKTKAPTTKAPATKAPATKAPTTKPSNNVYPGPIDPYVPYHELPFGVLYNKAGKLPDNLKYMPQADYKSGPQARAHPGFDHWQPMPWLEDNTGKDLQFDWKKLLPKQA